jgi:hypothetical protein
MENSRRPMNGCPRMFTALGVSLTSLSPYTPSSVISSPAFGLPSAPPVKTDVFVLMPFLATLEPVYDHIKAVAASLGLSVARADDFFPRPRSLPSSGTRCPLPGSSSPTARGGTPTSFTKWA